MNTTAQEVAALKVQLGKKLFALAISPAPATKADEAAAVKAVKGRKAMAITKAVELIREARALIQRGRAERAQHENVALNKRWHFDRTPAKPGPILAKRLARYKVAAARRAVASIMPQLSGDTTLSVEVAVDYAAVGADHTTGRGDQYSRRCTYRKTDGRWDVFVQPQWTIQVDQRGLAKVDGLPTLAALPVETETEGEEVFRAKWLERGRGFAVHTREGYIVRRTVGEGVYTAHAPSIAGARALITRQLPESHRAVTERQARLAAKIEAMQAELRAKLESGRLNGCAQVVVTIADSLAVGNCGTGTRAWIAAHFPGRKSATVEEILGIQDQHERVLRACIRAIARQH